MDAEGKRKAIGTDKLCTYDYNRGTAANDRSAGRGPKYFKCGRKVFYWVDDLEQWLKRQPVLTIDSISEGQGDEN
jgi:hypothetical protein